MTETTELLHVTELQREDDEAREAAELARVSPELTVDQLVGQIELVQDAMRRAMVDGEHYGVIPGTQKPTLLKPGAEKLCLLFRLAPTYEVTRRELDGGHVEYEVVCTLTHITTGRFSGQGVGLCTTMESRYRYRKGSHACPECGASSIIKGKQEFGGGWLCWKKKDGCGAKFPDAAFSTDDLKQVENPDLADVYNTVLKIAKKRAHVDASLTATAASDIFTQDMEDTSRSVPFVGTTPEPPSSESPQPQGPWVGQPLDAPAATAETTRPEDQASAYWQEAREKGVSRSWALQTLQDAGGDFAAAMSALDVVATLQQTEGTTDGK